MHTAGFFEIWIVSYMPTEDIEHGFTKSIEQKAFKPDLYKPEMCQKLKDAMAKGATIRMAAKELGISWEAFKGYIKNIEEFAEAYENGKALAQAHFESLSNDYMVKDRDNPLELDIRNHHFVMATRFGVRQREDEVSGPNNSPDSLILLDKVQELIGKIRGETI